MVLTKGTMLQFRQFFNVPNMTFSTFNIKFDIWTNIKVNIFYVKWFLLNLAHFKAYYRIYAMNTNIQISTMEPNGTIWFFSGPFYLTKRQLSSLLHFTGKYRLHRVLLCWIPWNHKVKIKKNQEKCQKWP